MIEVLGSTIKIDDHDLECNYQQEIAVYFSTLDDAERMRLLNSIIEIGWISSKISRSKVELDYLERATSQWTSQFATEMNGMSELFFNSFKEDLLIEVQQIASSQALQSGIITKTLEIQDKTTMKGLAFEVEVEKTLSNLAAMRSGRVDYVGTDVGNDGSKKGDFVFRDGMSNLTIAIEAKDLSSRLSVHKIEELIADTVTNRSAELGIFVVKNGHCLPDFFKNFYMGENYIACTLENLGIAVRVAALWSYKKSKSKITEQDFMALLGTIKKDIEMIDEIIKSANSSKKSASKASSLAQELKDSLETKISNFLKTEEFE